MRKQIVIVSLILCAAFVNAQEQPPVENPNTAPADTTVPGNNSTQPVDPNSSQPVNPNNSTLPVQPENPNNSTLPENPNNSTLPENPNNSTLPENPNNSTEPVQPENPNNTTQPVQPENPNNSTSTENPNNSTSIENPNNSTQPATPLNPNNSTDNTTNPNNSTSANSTSQGNSTAPTGVTSQELNEFMKRDKPEDWILSWSVAEEDFNKCKEDQEACCFSVGSITPALVQQGDKNAIQFKGPATGKNCPQDGNLVITLMGKNNDQDLNPLGQEASGVLQFTNNMQGSNTEQTPEERSLFIIDQRSNSTQPQNNSTQPQNNSTQPQTNSTQPQTNSTQPTDNSESVPVDSTETAPADSTETAPTDSTETAPTDNTQTVPQEGVAPIVKHEPAQQSNQTNSSDSFGIMLPGHPNDNTKDSSLNVLRLINKETVQSSSSSASGSDSGSESSDGSSSPTSGKILSACVFALIALVISI